MASLRRARQQLRNYVHTTHHHHVEREEILQKEGQLREIARELSTNRRAITKTIEHTGNDPDQKHLISPQSFSRTSEPVSMAWPLTESIQQTLLFLRLHASEVMTSISLFVRRPWRASCGKAPLGHPEKTLLHCNKID